MPVQSFCDLRDFLREQARCGYLALQRSRPGETICAFALDTDHDTVAFGAWGITEEQFAQLLAEHNRKYPPTGYLERICREAALKLSPQEWPEIEYSRMPVETEPIDAGKWLSDMMAFIDSWTSIPGNTFEAFRSRAFRAMADALHTLDNEGLFGFGSERDALVLFLSISDSEEDWYLQIESSRMLNPRHVYRRLLGSIPAALRWILLTPYLVRYSRKGPIIARVTS